MRKTEGRDWLFIEVPEDGKKAIDEYAKAKGSSAAELTREALEYYMKKRGQHLSLKIPKPGRPKKVS